MTLEIEGYESAKVLDLPGQCGKTHGTIACTMNAEEDSALLPSS